MLFVAILFLIYYFFNSIRSEKSSDQQIQHTKTAITLSDSLQQLFDSIQQLSPAGAKASSSKDSLRLRRIGQSLYQNVEKLRLTNQHEPAELASLDSIDSYFRILNHPAVSPEEYQLALNNIHRFIAIVRNQEEQQLIQYQLNAKAKRSLLNTRIFLVLGVILALSILFVWHLWYKHKLSQRTSMLQAYNHFLISNIDEAIISTDMQDTILSWNKGAEAMFGWTAAEAIGKKRSSLLPYDNLLEKDIKSQIRKGRSFFSGEVIQQDKYGKKLYVRKTISPVFNDQYKQIGFVSINMDITASKFKADMLKASNELLEKGIRDRTNHLERANKLYQFISELNKMILRTTNEQTLYRDICEIAVQHGKFRMAWIGLVDPETGLVKPVVHAGYEEGYLSTIKPISIRADVPEGRGPTGMALREGTYFVCQDVDVDPAIAPWREEQVRRSYLSSMAVPIRKSGLIIGAITVYAPEKFFFNEAEISLMLAAGEDITFALDYLASEQQRLLMEKQLTESEEKFRTLVEKSLAGVYIIQDNVFTYVNDRFAEIFGYENPDAIIGKMGIDDLTAPDDIERVKEQINKRLTGNKGSVYYTIKARRKDQSFIHVEVAGSFIQFKNQPAILGTLFDITYQVEEELRIGKAVIKAQENERQQIGMELHDNVKQILAVTQMYLGMAINKLHKTQTEAANLLASCKDFIGESIVELRKLSHQLAPSTSASVSFEESVSMLVSNMNADKQMNVILNIEPFEKGFVSQDILTTLYRILQEQLNNIKKYAEASEVVIHSSLSDNTIFMRIIDNGKGFDPNTVKEGIGLENIRRRVKFFSGNVQIVSSPGNGCEIEVEIPLQGSGH